jgi:hypothetical protein
MYISIKTLQNEESTKEDITQWLTYWYIIFITLFLGWSTLVSLIWRASSDLFSSLSLSTSS